MVPKDLINGSPRVNLQLTKTLLVQSDQKVEVQRAKRKNEEPEEVERLTCMSSLVVVHSSRYVGLVPVFPKDDLAGLIEWTVLRLPNELLCVEDEVFVCGPVNITLVRKDGTFATWSSLRVSLEVNFSREFSSRIGANRASSLQPEKYSFCVQLVSKCDPTLKVKTGSISVLVFEVMRPDLLIHAVLG